MKNTLKLPKTKFALRNTNNCNPENLYNERTELRKNSPKYVLHDGPPFANGSPHAGTALNKTLKDLVVRTKFMEGYNVVFRPGWDCHGLPTEMKAMKSGAKDPLTTRQMCRDFAMNAVNTQREAFKTLGVSADWENPYLTMDNWYVANVMRTFAQFLKKDLVKFQTKPVWWSPARTALAHMELEYKEVTDNSAWYAFNVNDVEELVVWTTMPWTMLANKAVACNPDFTYELAEWRKDDNSRTFWMLEGKELPGWTKGNVLKTCLGSEFKTAEGPNGNVSVLHSKEVATDGTGFVHLAPAYGLFDWEMMPGTYESLLDEKCMLDGKNPFSMLPFEPLAVKEYTHEYPHCWRTKKRAVMRSTPQFFVDLTKLNLNFPAFQPENGTERLKSACSGRPDWCVSRQRSWGVPLPVFFKDGLPVLSYENAMKAADYVEKYGADEAFKEGFGALCGVDGTRTRDTLDVWLDSGTGGMYVDSDLYVEAHDQFRGWFQSTALVAAAYDRPFPSKKVAVHGWVMKGNEKFAKSNGDVLDLKNPELFRLWVASLDWTKDVSLNLLQEERLNKLRGVLRFCLSNHFDVMADKPGEKTTPVVDEMLHHLYNLNKDVREMYSNMNFGNAMSRLMEECTWFSQWFDLAKDALYTGTCEEREPWLNGLWWVFNVMVRLVAPVVPGTAQEAWAVVYPGSVHHQTFLDMPDFKGLPQFLFDFRADVLKKAEAVRLEGKQTKLCRMKVVLPKDVFVLENSQLRELFGTYDLAQGNDLGVFPSELAECERCRQSTGHTLCPRCRSECEATSLSEAENSQ